jgi:glycosyltransferase involved in cell wall biosynthesis
MKKEYLKNGTDTNRKGPAVPFPDIRVSVIIAARHGQDIIQIPLRTLLEGSRQPDEIVVLDQSDDDLTKREVDVARSLPGGEVIRHVPSSRRGLSANRNDALREAKGDFIASVDQDVGVDQRWLERMLGEWVEKWERKPVLITGRILPAPEYEGLSLITAIRTSRERFVRNGNPRAYNVLIGAQFGASRELFEKMGEPLFDERLGIGTNFPGADDDEFAYRVQKTGMPIVYDPSIVVTHHTERESDWRRVSFRYAFGCGAAAAKHLLQGDIRVMRDLVRAIVVNGWKSLKFAIRLKEPESSARLLGMTGLIMGFFRWIFQAVTGRLKP